MLNLDSIDQIDAEKPEQMDVFVFREKNCFLKKKLDLMKMFDNTL